MYNDLFNKFIICVLFAVFLANCGYGNNSISDVNDFFVVGDYRVVEVATSKLSHVSGRSFPFVAPLPKGTISGVIIIVNTCVYQLKIN